MSDSFWLQIDCRLDQWRSRFWMRDCGSDDIWVSKLIAGGWKTVDAPMPLVLTKLCRALSPVYVELGDCDGFFSLLAATSGAELNFHLLCDPNCSALLAANFEQSALASRLRCLNRSEQQADLLKTANFYQLLQGLANEKAVFLKINDHDAFAMLAEFNVCSALKRPFMTFKVFSKDRLLVWREYCETNALQCFTLHASGLLEPGFPEQIVQEVQLLLVPVDFLATFTQALQSS